jgi:hypothetical protein
MTSGRTCLMTTPPIRQRTEALYTVITIGEKAKARNLSSQTAQARTNGAGDGASARRRKSLLTTFTTTSLAHRSSGLLQLVPLEHLLEQPLERGWAATTASRAAFNNSRQSIFRCETHQFDRDTTASHHVRARCAEDTATSACSSGSWRIVLDPVTIAVLQPVTIAL